MFELNWTLEFGRNILLYVINFPLEVNQLIVICVCIFLSSFFILTSVLLPPLSLTDLVFNMTIPLINFYPFLSDI